MNVEMSEATRDLLSRERNVIADLRATLERLNASESDFQDLKTALRDLEGLFTLVVCGEFNSGKSTLLNALLGEEVMPSGVTPTTDRITIVTYGERARDVDEGDFTLRREYPAELLRQVALVDTPGTNAVVKKHQELTEKFVPRADLVLFVTSADRAFTESERTFLEMIRSWGKKIVVVVNKLDILANDSEHDQVMRFVADNAKETLGVAPQVFGLKARQAFRAKRDGDDAALKDSGLPALERYVSDSLAGTERLKLKLRSPLGVAQRLTDRYLSEINEQLQHLEEDRRTLEEIARQREQFREDMASELGGYVSRVQGAFYEVERRGDIFFNDVIRVTNLSGMLSSAQIRDAFEARVLAGTDRDLQRALSELADWLIQRNLQLWEDVTGYVQERRFADDERVIGEVGGRFQYDRTTLLKRLELSTEDVLSRYNEDTEADQVAKMLQGTVVRFVLTVFAGFGLGAVGVVLLAGTSLDIASVGVGVLVVLLGFLVIPRRRRRLKARVADQMETLREQLEAQLEEQVNEELQRASERLTGAVAPYTRFVKSELGRLHTLDAELSRIDGQLGTLRADVDDLRA